jgi:hypothetical protein
MRSRPWASRPLGLHASSCPLGTCAPTITPPSLLATVKSRLEDAGLRLWAVLSAAPKIGKHFWTTCVYSELCTVGFCQPPGGVTFWSASRGPQLPASYS